MGADDPTNRYEPPVEDLSDVAAAESTGAWPFAYPAPRRLPTSALGLHLARVGAPGYLTGVADVVEGEVHRRLTEHASREPARLVVDGSPKAMAWMLGELGYAVTTPDDMRVTRENIAQDIAEQVPGGGEALEWFDSAPSEKDAGGLYDLARRAFLAGYRAAQKLCNEGMNP